MQTIAGAVGCSGCGVRAIAKDRRWVILRDAPAGHLAVVVRWHKRIWVCRDRDYDVKTWTEQTTLAGPRRSLTDAAALWTTNRVEAIEEVGPGVVELESGGPPPRSCCAAG